MDRNEEFNAKEKPKLELSMGPDGEVLITEIPIERIAQETLDKEVNIDCISTGGGNEAGGLNNCEWPSLSFDDISLSCDFIATANQTDNKTCAKCSAELTADTYESHICDLDKVIPLSFEDALGEVRSQCDDYEICSLIGEKDTDTDKPEPKIKTRKPRKRLNRPTPKKIPWVPKVPDKRTIDEKKKAQGAVPQTSPFKRPQANLCRKDCRVCHLCNKEFPRRKLLITHIRRHTGTLNLACEHCSKKFAAVYDLERHVRLMHTDKNKAKKYACFCDICRIPFYSQTGMLDHKRRAHAKILSRVEPVHPCNICGIKFSAKSGLETHMKSHEDEVVIQFYAPQGLCDSNTNLLLLI